MKYLIIELQELQCDDTGERAVYTSSKCVFEHESDALDYVKDKKNLLIIDCDNTKVINTAFIGVKK